MADLENQTVLITGCSTGIGLALAREFHKKGHQTFATARRPESLDQLKAEGIPTEQLDVTDPTSIERAVSSVIEKAGRLDILVNNAGFNIFGPVAEVPVDDFRKLFETNLLGTLAVSQAVIPKMVDQGSGRIVNIGSIAGVVVSPFVGPYGASKAAVHVLSDVLRVEVAPFGIQVICVQPGAVRSSIADTGSQDLDRFQSSKSLYHKVYDQIKRRAGSSQENPMESEDFAEQLVSAITQEKAPIIVRLGGGVETYAKLADLPKADFDNMMSDYYTLDLLRKK
jgi:NAD(P)-dependent dehydrogenase (short-subunit alcohol dehydrogenase family)